MDEEHQDLYKPVYEALLNFKTAHSREQDEEEESTKQQRGLSRNYNLSENPKKKLTQKSLESMKKVSFRSEECGNGFRYEKSPSNHQAMMHLSKNQRVHEDLVSTATADELEVAESLILLSKGSPKIVDEANPETPKGSYDLGCLRNKKPSEFESEGFTSERRLMEERVSGYKTSKEPASFLGHKCKLDQQKLRNGSEFGTGFWSNEQKLMKGTSKEEASFLGEKKSGDSKTKLGVRSIVCSDRDTEMDTESDKRSGKHQCRFCKKIFSSSKALGGHQKVHRMSKSKNQKKCKEDESVRCSATKEKKTHKSSHLLKESQVGSCSRWSQEESRQETTTLKNRE